MRFRRHRASPWDYSCSETRGRRLAAALTTVCLIAFVARLIPVLFYPSLAHPDETFQSVEQAHRIVYGLGLVPWEFVYGVRSWLLPGALAGLMEATRLIGDGPDYYLPVIAAAMAGLATAPVVCAFLWGRRFFGLTGAVVAASVVALAPELVYFGARTLSEAVAGHILILAIFLLTIEWGLEP